MKKLTKAYKNLDEMREAGWTDQDLDALKNAPRSKAEDYEHDHTWFPEVDGFRLIYTCWNDEERKHYNDFKNRRSCSSTSRSSKPATQERNQEYFDWLLKNAGNEAAAKYLEMIVPNDPLLKFYEKFKTFDFSKVTAKQLLEAGLL